MPIFGNAGRERDGAEGPRGSSARQEDGTKPAPAQPFPGGFLLWVLGPHCPCAAASTCQCVPEPTASCATAQAESSAVV